ncbi:hypothetical protein A5791_19870 [Mycobacterium sp. 852002-51163_SCH5372311]|nr:hypothetical protein A5791_19870 [Mycobacterium sp. 852002-51163_SCH5372311]
MTDEASRWLIVCGCAGHPEELVGAVDVNAAGEAAVWSTGRSGGSPLLKGAHRMIRNAPAGERRELLRKLQTREVRLRATVTFRHSPCGRSLRVNEYSLGELLAAVSKLVPDQRVSLELLCVVNGSSQRGATR